MPAGSAPLPTAQADHSVDVSLAVQQILALCRQPQWGTWSQGQAQHASQMQQGQFPHHFHMPVHQQRLNHLQRQQHRQQQQQQQPYQHHNGLQQQSPSPDWAKPLTGSPDRPKPKLDVPASLQGHNLPQTMTLDKLLAMSSTKPGASARVGAGSGVADATAKNLTQNNLGDTPRSSSTLSQASATSGGSRAASGSPKKRSRDKSAAKNAGAAGGVPPAKRKASSSKFRGVSLHRRDGRWFARLSVKNEVRFLGSYDSEQAAALAVDDEEIRVRGSAATKLNFPDAQEREALRERLLRNKFESDMRNAALRRAPRR